MPKTSKRPVKPPTTKVKDQVKLPETVFVVVDIFRDYDPIREDAVGFLYSKEDAEEYRAGHEDEMTKGVAMFKFYEDKYYEALSEAEIQKYEKLKDEYNKYEDYSKTVVKKVQQIKKVK